MERRSAAASLLLPIRLHGIQLGRPTDLLLDVRSWQTLGFVAICGDESRRFLPFAAAQVSEEEIAVGSSLMLLEDITFYEQRGVSFRSLLGGEVERKGILRDLLIGEAGAVVELLVEHDGVLRQFPALGSAVRPTRASAA